MALYCIGDVQGCDAALGRLLEHIHFSPSRDTVYLLGDLVNRGPDSAAVLRRCRAAEGALHCLLGNHDLHLLATAHGVRKPSRRDTLDGVLQASDRAALLDWLRQQPLVRTHEHAGETLLMLHAGVLPAWSLDDAVALASEVHSVLRSADLQGFLQKMYGNTPERWSASLAGADRLRVIVNALTRLRFCTPEGRMEFATKEGGAAAAPPGYLPWFDVPARRTAGESIAFGHWSTLGAIERPGLIALDTGCVWGGCLSAARLDGAGRVAERIQVRCAQAQAPGRA